MEYTYFYIYLISVWVVLLVCSQFKPVEIWHGVIGAVTVAYSLAYEIIFGNWMGLYYYLDPDHTALYMVLAGVMMYPVLNVIYVLFLPKDKSRLLLYTGIWILAMILFEYVIIWQGIIVLTGWKPIPWSLATYAFTYLWINLLYRRLIRTMAVGEV